MTAHLIALPFLIPFAAAALLILLTGQSLALARCVSLAATLAGLLVAIALLVNIETAGTTIYAFGNWQPPYGIVFVADRLASLMILLLFALAVPACLAAMGGTDNQGKYFHPLFQLQIAGIAGTFLTGDLFNLFVCFEILLLASYVLLLHGGGHARTRAGVIYVALNLMGSAFFLIAVAIIYGLVGTLNLADLAAQLPNLAPDSVPWVRAAFAVLIGVFLLKSALLPMSFWLPGTYSAAAPPVAMLFVILTKVGIVATLRITLLVSGAPDFSNLVMPWLPILSLATILLGTIGLLAARHLSAVAANLVLISSGTLLTAVAFATPSGLSALLFYLPHSTLITAGLFLLSGLIAEQRGTLGDRLVAGPPPARSLLLGSSLGLFAIAAIGLPPMAGFLAKLMLLQGAVAPQWAAIWWFSLLLSGFVATLVLARSAGYLFWQADPPSPARPIENGPLVALILLATISPLMTLAAAPISAFTQSVAKELLQRQPYIQAVLAPDAGIQRERRP